MLIDGESVAELVGCLSKFETINVHFVELLRVKFNLMCVKAVFQCFSLAVHGSAQSFAPHTEMHVACRKCRVRRLIWSAVVQAMQLRAELQSLGGLKKALFVVSPLQRALETFMLGCPDQDWLERSCPAHPDGPRVIISR